MNTAVAWCVVIRIHTSGAPPPTLPALHLYISQFVFYLFLGILVIFFVLLPLQSNYHQHFIEWYSDRWFGHGYILAKLSVLRVIFPNVCSWKALTEGLSCNPYIYIYRVVTVNRDKKSFSLTHSKLNIYIDISLSHSLKGLLVLCTNQLSKY